MPSLSSHRVLLASLLSLGLVGGLSALPAPANAQVGARAYAPEDLWTLNTADQTRVISLEYREQSSGRNIPNDQLRFYLDQVRLSRWTFSRVKQDIAKSLGNTGGWNPGPGPNPGVQTIRCESSDGRNRTCATPWQSQSRLIKQLSSARCTAGQTWFTSRGQVTVSGGCRAEFGPGMGGPGGPGHGGPGGQQVTVQCESTDGRLRTCGSNLVGRAQLQRQISKQRCVEDSNFGLRNGSIWVNGGCRGVFLARARNGNGPGNGNGDGQAGNYNVTCSSDRGRYTTCAWDARYGMPRMIQQLSNESCREGSTWGYSARAGLWVNGGCRARFGNR